VSVWRKRVDVTDEAHPLRDYARRLVGWIGKDYKQVAKDFEVRGIAKPTRAQHFLGWNCAQWHLCTAETYDLLNTFYEIEKWGGYLPFGELYAKDRAYYAANTKRGATYNIPNGLEYVSTILRCNKDLDTFHPTQKPLDLMAFLVDVFSNPGDLVLDACMGSGTTAVACIKEKRNFIGFETDPTFYAKACRRIEEARKNLTLF
jgi:site-specific DNA-methyltransferase (adenine-specific)